MFDPRLGRFLQPDPLGFEAGDQNLYRFVANTPTNATDPSGTRIVYARVVDPSGGGDTKFRYVYVPDGEKDPPGTLPMPAMAKKMIQRYLGDRDAEIQIAEFLTHVQNNWTLPNFWPFLNSQCVRWTNGLMGGLEKSPLKFSKVWYQQYTLSYPATGGPEHSIILVRLKGDPSGVVYGVDNGSLGTDHNIFDPLTAYFDPSLPQETRDDIAKAMKEFTGKEWPPRFLPNGPRRNIDL